MPLLRKRAALAPHTLHQLGERSIEDRDFFRVGVDLGLELHLGLNLPARGQLGGTLVCKVFLPGRLSNLVVAGDSTGDQGRQDGDNHASPGQEILVGEGAYDCAASAR